jgi:hypothetical protein
MIVFMWNCKEARKQVKFWTVGSIPCKYARAPMQARSSAHPPMKKKVALMRCAVKEMKKSQVISSAPSMRSSALRLTW